MKAIFWMGRAMIFSMGLLGLLPLYILNMVGPYQGNHDRARRLDQVVVRWHGMLFHKHRA